MGTTADPTEKGGDLRARWWSAGGAMAAVSLSLVLTGPALSQVRPDPAGGEIDGRRAVGVWAVDGGERVAQEPYTVYVVPMGSPETMWSSPAGEWFLPPEEGRYRVWVESAEAISPAPVRLVYTPEPFRGSGTSAMLEVDRAGRVTADVDRAVRTAGSDRWSLRLLHVPPSPPPSPGPVFLRAVSVRGEQEATRMPVGEVVGLLFDRASARYRAVSRPVGVVAGETVEVTPRLDPRPADVLVILRRPDVAIGGTDEEVGLSLRAQGTEPLAPDVVVAGAESIYALWYEVDLDHARLEVDSTRVRLPASELQLGGRGLTVFEADLRPRPWLEVRMEPTAAIEAERAEVVVTPLRSRQRIARAEAEDPSSTPVRLEGLPAEELTVALTLRGDPGWTFYERVDLREGEGREVVFRPDPIVLSGRLHLEDAPRPGTVWIYTDHVHQGGDSVMVVESDEEGRYEAVLQTAGRYPMRVALQGLEGPPFRPRPRYLDSDTTLDIHVPRSDVEVQVGDAASGEPVPGALVIHDIEFERDGKRLGSSSSTRSDEDGLAVLPPLRQGDLTLWVEKEGYLRAGPVETTVVPGVGRDLRIDLEPATSTARLTLRLPDGRPAAGAEVRVQLSAWNEPSVWEGQADDRGEVGVPNRAGGAWLLVRHPAAGSWVQGWDPRGREEVTWTLPPATGALVVRTVGLDGEPVAWSGVAVRFPEAWVAGSALAWLAGTRTGGSDGSGLWTAEGLPAVELGAIAGSPEVIRLALQGFLDGSVQALEPPWPAEPVRLFVSR